MAAVANNPKFAKKVGIPKKVGEEFMKADKGRKFSRGGEMAMKPMKQLKAAQADAMQHNRMQRKEQLGNFKSALKSSGAYDKKDIKTAVQGVRAQNKAEKKSMEADFKGGRQAMRAGIQQNKQATSVAGMKKGGMACSSKTMKYAKGGAIDGCAKKGKTRGKMI